MAHDLGTERLTWGRLAGIVGHARHGDAIWEHLTDGAPSIDQRLAQATEVAVRRLAWMWTDQEKAQQPYPEPLPLPADHRAQQQKAAVEAAREAEMVAQLVQRREEIQRRREAAAAAAETEGDHP